MTKNTDEDFECVTIERVLLFTVLKTGQRVTVAGDVPSIDALRQLIKETCLGEVSPGFIADMNYEPAALLSEDSKRVIPGFELHLDKIMFPLPKIMEIKRKIPPLPEREEAYKQVLTRASPQSLTAQQLRTYTSKYIDYDISRSMFKKDMFGLFHLRVKRGYYNISGQCRTGN